MSPIEERPSEQEMSSQDTPKQRQSQQSKPTNIGQVRCAGKVPSQANNRANVIRNESSSSDMEN